MLLVAAGMIFFGPTVSGADGWDRLTAGLRGGVSASSFNDPFVQVETFADWDLPDHKPWRFQSSSGYYVRMRLDAAAGWLTGNTASAFVASAGPTFVMGKAGFPVSIEIGSSPTILSRYQFGETDLGVPFQFTSHLGLNVDLGSRVALSYRLQHMSNAGLGDHNPGLDLHCVGIGYRF
jgi:hypothetical protein